MKDKFKVFKAKTQEKLQNIVDWCGEHVNSIISISYITTFGLVGGYIIATGIASIRDEKRITDTVVEYLQAVLAKQL